MSSQALVRAFAKYRELLGRLQSDPRSWSRIDHRLQHELVSFGTALESYLASIGHRGLKEKVGRDCYWLKYRAEIDRGLKLEDLVIRDSLVLKEISWKLRQALLAHSVQAATWYLQNKCLVVSIRRDFKDPEILFHDRCDSSDVQKRVKDALELVYPEVLKRYETGSPIEIQIVKNGSATIWWSYRNMDGHMGHPSTAEKHRVEIKSSHDPKC